MVKGQAIKLSVRTRPTGYRLGISEKGVGIEAKAAHESHPFEMDVYDRVPKRVVELVQTVKVET